MSSKVTVYFIRHERDYSGSKPEYLELLQVEATLTNRQVWTPFCLATGFRSRFDIAECAFSPEEALAIEEDYVQGLEKQAAHARALIDDLRKRVIWSHAEVDTPRVVAIGDILEQIVTDGEDDGS